MKNAKHKKVAPVFSLNKNPIVDIQVSKLLFPNKYISVAPIESTWPGIVALVWFGYLRLSLSHVCLRAHYDNGFEWIDTINIGHKHQHIHSIPCTAVKQKM